MKKFTILLAGAMSSLFALTVFAHGGHGTTPPSALTHYLLEPLHLLSAFAPLAVISAAVWLLRRRAKV